MKIQYRAIRKEIDRGIRRVLDSQMFIMGPAVEAFEKDVSAFLGGSQAVGVASGTDALLLSLMALGVRPGDQVLTVSYTFFATGGSISRLGAVPVFLDIDRRTYDMDAQRVEDHLRRNRRKRVRPKVLIPVHLYGQMADMGSLMEIARRYEMRVVEDAAQAIGATQKQGNGTEAMAGTLGDLGCFSFFPSKNLGGFGDGGMVVTGDAELAERVRILKNHGAHPKYYHRHIGINSRLDALQAVVLQVKLKYLSRWTAGRRRNADRYEALFRESGLVPEFVSLPVREEKNFHIFNQFVIRTKKRDALREFLSGRGVGTEIYYPVPLHLQRCYQELGYRRGDLPESEKAARETLALPIFPELTLAQQRKVVDEIKNFFDSKGGEK